MTDKQITARLAIKRERNNLTPQQMRTLNGLVKSGDIDGAMSGLQTIIRRKLNK